MEKNQHELLNRVKTTLENSFGLKEFRQGQLEVILHVLEGENALCVMPTGGGKSLCYQLPSQMLPGLTIVVSPLISLMKDQVDSLVECGIKAGFINSSQPMEEQRRIMNAVTAGDVKLLYVAPERFRNSWFMEIIDGIQVSLFAIDEAHCISEWGHDFRPDYLRLAPAVKRLKAERVLACTATATPMVRDGILSSLEIERSRAFVYGFNRPNLTFRVLPAPNKAAKKVMLTGLLESITGAAIVYAATRKNVEAIQKILAEQGENSVIYHAGLNDEDREKAQEVFMSGKARVAVATNAFGMGVDRSDIRLVVHWDFPRTLEALYQEAGRAGRDGKPATAAVLFSYADKHLQDFFIRNSIPEEDTVLAVLDTLREIADPDGVILRTNADIARQVPADINEMSISSCVITLEKAGFLYRLGNSGRSAWVRVIEDLAAIKSATGNRQKSRKAIVEALEHIDHSGGEFDIDRVARTSGIGRDSLRRTLSSMAHDREIEYEPPFRGRGIQLASDTPLRPDLTYLNNRRIFEQEKLKQVVNYCTTMRCRRAVLMNYFGENHPSGCNGCDRCLPELRYNKKSSRTGRTGSYQRSINQNIAFPSRDSGNLHTQTNTPIPKFRFGSGASEQTGNEAIGKSENFDNRNSEELVVLALRLTGGRLGEGKIVDILRGSRKRDVLALRPERWPVYGSLAHLSVDEVKSIIAMMIEKRKLMKTPGMYPLLRLV